MQFLSKAPAPSLELLAKPFTSDLDEFTGAFFGILHGSGGTQHVVDVLTPLLHHELSKPSDPLLAMRSNNITTKLLELFLKEVGQNYLKTTLKDVISEICSKREVLELDPNKAESQAVLAFSAEKLTNHLYSVWKAIRDSVEYCPREIKDVLRSLLETVKDESLAHRLVGSLFFLRFVGVAIISPLAFDIVQGERKQKRMKGIIVVAFIIPVQ